MKRTPLRSRSQLKRGKLLCIPCHRAQEKRTDAYIAETGVDLYEKAAAHTAQWRKETQ